MAQILTSISGLPISAASAGFAPTNMADVSAIASSYQVVSATGTQLYAGTAYVTSINSAPLSASRAGNAANASLANSAWYDGTGRFISALPDSATVSSIASSYAESAASGKLDTTAQVVTSTAGDGVYVTAINGMGISGEGGGGATGDYVEKSAMNVAIGSGNTASADISFAQGSGNSAKYRSFAQGSQNTATAWSVAIGGSNTARSAGAAFGVSNTAFNSSIAVGRQNYASSDSLCVGVENAATKVSVALGQYNTAKNTAFSYGRYVSSQNNAFAIGNYNLKGNGDTTGDSAAFVIGDGTGTGTAARHDLMLVTKDGEITMYSSTADTVGTGIMSSIRTISAAATGGVNSATVSAIASSYAESAASSKMDTSAMSAYATTAYVTSGLSGKEDEFNAGTGLEFVQSGSDRVLQVEAPVDIVAGPGIVIDNPDGNTLRVSMAQDYEVTLWSGSCLRQSSAAVSLSESASNFEKIEIYALPNPSNGFNSPQVFTYPGSNTAGAYLCPFMTTGLKGKFSCGLWTITNGTSFKLIAAGQTDNYPTLNWDNSYGGVVKVVGIHRIANN